MAVEQYVEHSCYVQVAHPTCPTHAAQNLMKIVRTPRMARMLSGIPGVHRNEDAPAASRL